jgi:hypothetical protein
MAGRARDANRLVRSALLRMGSRRVGHSLLGHAHAPRKKPMPMPISLLRSALFAAVMPFVLAASTLSEIVPASTLDNTERAAFTASGRCFVIGIHASGTSVIAELTRSAQGGYVLTDYVSGTLEGTKDGSVAGQVVGDSCQFSGMAVHDNLLYAGCYATDGRAALLQVDTEQSAVRAGYFDSCNRQPSASPCENINLYPNGMAVDSAGRVYFSNTLSHVSMSDGNIAVQVQGSNTLTQVTVNLEASDASHLAFRYRDWFSADILTDSFVPNGVQIDGQVLYYAAGPNINKLQISADGSAGEARVHYRGPALSYIDDFAVRAGAITLARTLAPAIVGVEPAAFDAAVLSFDSFPMSLDLLPSSITHIPAGNPMFSGDPLLVTSFFGGGLHLLSAR